MASRDIDTLKHNFRAYRDGHAVRNDTRDEVPLGKDIAAAAFVGVFSLAFVVPAFLVGVSLFGASLPTLVLVVLSGIASIFAVGPLADTLAGIRRNVPDEETTDVSLAERVRDGLP